MTELQGECSYRRAEEEEEIPRRSSACSQQPCLDRLGGLGELEPAVPRAVRVRVRLEAHRAGGSLRTSSRPRSEHDLP